MKEHGIIFTGESVRAIIAGRKTQTRRLMKPQPPTIEAVHSKAGDGFSIINPSGKGMWRPAGPVWAVRDLLGKEPQWRCPYGTPGDALWVKEAFALKNIDANEYLIGSIKSLGIRAYGGAAPTPGCHLRQRGGDVMVQYAANPATVEELRAMPWMPAYRGEDPPGWRSPIFMPRWASRITLQVTSVRAERLQAITEDDARAEGVEQDTEPCDHTRQGCDEIGCLGPTHRSTFATLWDAINGKRAPWSANPWVWVVGFEVAR